MRIALLGYGRMGKAIEQEAIKRDHTISFIIDQDNRADLAKVSPENTDAIIEFTHPDSFFTNFRETLKLGVPVVSGTTGWYDQMEQVKAEVAEAGTGFMFGSNFSIGVNVLFKVNQQLAQLMNRYSDYDVFIEEQHHRYKADGPSGTAHSLAQQVIDHLDRKTAVSDADLRTRPPKPEELSVGFIRAGEIPGKHTVTYTSDIDTISISHNAFNRRGFALGAVVAAEWMNGKTGFYEFADIF
ncbi:4-hydroxy-tetrahydrodipicolinate reductase [Pontibacter sp. G13]|uniref:4-hydroxy-tetrahydrodipicolinate reductase n=1 Tax=Pontibacter sp. G13 TaxID=3074898 RepID=UPI00288BFFF5|nr:4-hydroxy-tetrahydrodipicolinate reductase [Pontibacter sp. G13]WNJ19794.1 4-hydroxy-tetrahydrodipicolinate reductase [Pontibacter sp. G13]